MYSSKNSKVMNSIISSEITPREAFETLMKNVHKNESINLSKLQELKLLNNNQFNRFSKIYQSNLKRNDNPINKTHVPLKNQFTQFLNTINNEEKKKIIIELFEKKEKIHKHFWNRNLSFNEKAKIIKSEYPNFKGTSFKLLSKKTYNEAIKELQETYNKKKKKLEQSIILRKKIKDKIKDKFLLYLKKKYPINHSASYSVFKIFKSILNSNNDIDKIKKTIREHFTNFKFDNITNNTNLLNYLKGRDSYLSEKSSKTDYFYENLNIITFNNLNKTFNKNIDLYIYLGISILDNYSIEIKTEIYQCLINYLIDLKKDISSIYNYHIENIILLKLTKLLLKKNFSNSTYIEIYNSNPVSKGATGRVFRVDNKIYKFGHLRIYYKSNFSKTKQIYGTVSYIPSLVLIEYSIQKYLHTLNNNYVPDIDNIDFDYDNDLSLMIMDYAFKESDSSYIVSDLQKFIETEMDRQSFVVDFFNVFKKICEILNFYQEKCCFVHNDLHFGNIFIKYKYEDSIFIFDIKLIDFGFSSIIVYHDGKYKLFKDINLSGHKKIDFLNPFISNIWDKIDILFFISYFIFSNISIKKIENEYMFFGNSKNILTIIKILCNIFDIDLNYIKKYIESNLEFKLFPTIFKIVRIDSYRKKIYGEKFNLDICKPSKIIDILEKINIKINSLGSITNNTSITSNLALETNK